MTMKEKISDENILEEDVYNRQDLLFFYYDVFGFHLSRWKNEKSILGGKP